MKFQKLNENKLKIFLKNDELPNSGNFDDFISNSGEAKNTFLAILDKAYDEVGFNVADYKIKIDAVALRNGDFVFTVTKLIKVRGRKKTVKPVKVSKVDNSNSIIYKFESFDDFYNFCAYIKRIKLANIRLLSPMVELYLYNDNYYLSLSSINQNYKEIGKFYSTITEFCKYFSSKNLFASVLKEKGKLFIKNNAIVNCQNL